MEARVTGSPNRNEIGIAGMVSDETKNMIMISRNNRESRIVKAGRLFELRTADSKFTINGNYSRFRPEDRIKEQRRIRKMLRNGD